MQNFYDPDPDGLEPHDPRHAAHHFERYLRNEGHFYMDPSTIEEVFEYYRVTEALDKANKLMAFAIDRFPYRADFYLKKALLDYECNKLAQSHHNVNQALALRPVDQEALLHKARVLFQLGRQRDAMDLFHTLLDIAEDSPEVYFQVGLVCEESDQLPLAVSYFKNALRYSRADEPLEEALNEIFYCYEKLDQPQEAIRFCRFYLDHVPYSALAWYHLSLLYSRTDAYENAIQAADYAVLIDETFISAFYAKGSALMALGHYHSAIRVFIESLHHDASDIATLLAIGECYEEIGETGRGRFYFKKVTELYPQLPDGWHGLAATLEIEGQSMKALHFYHKCLERDPKHSDAWFGIADCEYQIGNLVSAFEALDRAIQIDPEDLEMWQQWGQRLASDGYYDEAIELLERGLHNNPQFTELAYQIAAHAFTGGDSRRGFLYLENALLMDFEKHSFLYRFSPQIANMRPIQELIAQYQPS